MERIEAIEGWNEGVLAAGGNFLQSWEWGEFQRRAGFSVLRYQDAQGGRAQLVRRPLPFGQHYWYCPRGPLGHEMFESLPERSELSYAAFIRFEPLEAPPKLFGARKVGEVQPAQTLIVDLKKDPEALLAGMHEKTRYNIRLAERKGVRVFAAGADEAAFGVFWDLMSETAERDRFHAHGREYYRGMLDVLEGDPAERDGLRPKARLLFAEHDGRVLAANLMLYFGGTATYLHGASSRERREVMAPYLLHWKAMETARAAGCDRYDFWGVAPEGVENHPWAGVTRFKRGFGGTYVSYPGTYDLPIGKGWYWAYRVAQKLRGR